MCSPDAAKALPALRQLGPTDLSALVAPVQGQLARLAGLGGLSEALGFTSPTSEGRARTAAASPGTVVPSEGAGRTIGHANEGPTVRTARGRGIDYLAARGSQAALNMLAVENWQRFARANPSGAREVLHGGGAFELARRAAVGGITSRLRGKE